MEKPELRERLMKARNALPLTQRNDLDHQLHLQLWQLPQYQAAGFVMTYLSFNNEINTWPVVEQAWADGKRVAVPKVRKYPKEIVAIEIKSKQDLEPGLWSIQEPVADEAIAPRELDLIVVPGLAFNQQGFRLGYGGGYYDRFLPQTKAFKVGFCYQQFFGDVPVLPWDQPVDLVITAEKL